MIQTARENERNRNKIVPERERESETKRQREGEEEFNTIQHWCLRKISNRFYNLGKACDTLLKFSY